MKSIINKIALFLSLFMLVFATLPAQRLPNDPVYSLSQFNGSFKWMKSLITYNPEEIEGSAYGFGHWPKGKVFMIDSLRYGDYPINIDLAESEIHIQEPYRGYMILITDVVDKFTFYDSSENRVRIFQKISNSEVPLSPYNPRMTRDRFHEILVDGPLKLLKLREKKLAPKDEMTTYANMRMNDEFIERTTYFLQMESGEIHKLRLSGSALGKLLPHVKKKIKAYQQEANLYLGDEAGMVRMIHVLNQYWGEISE